VVKLIYTALNTLDKASLTKACNRSLNSHQPQDILRLHLVVNLPYFQEEIMVKEDPIKIGEELETEANQEVLFGSRHACRLHTKRCQQACR